MRQGEQATTFWNERLPWVIEPGHIDRKLIGMAYVNDQTNISI